MYLKITSALKTKQDRNGELYERDPVRIIVRVEMSSDEEEDVHHPPNAKPPQSEELPHPGACEAETESVQSEEAEEDAVEEGGDEVVVGVADAREASPEEDPGPGALDTVQNSTASLGLLHLLPALASVVEAAVRLVVRGLVTSVVQRRVALQELPGQEVAGDQGSLHSGLGGAELRAGEVVRVPVVAGTVTQLPHVVLGPVFYCTFFSPTAGHCH